MNATLDHILTEWAQQTPSIGDAVARTIEQLAKAAVTVAETVSQGALGAAFAGQRGETNAAGDVQRNLDVHADELFIDAMRRAPVAVYASEELDAPVLLDATAPIALAIDPLDGSSNIEVNVSIGTIFSLLPAITNGKNDFLASFLQTGREQLAAGFFIYGPQLSLVLTLGDGVHIFTWAARQAAFIRIHANCAIEPKTREFAINASNYRHWNEPVRLYFDDCLKGGHGPREGEFNMRWIASLVAETYRPDAHERELGDKLTDLLLQHPEKARRFEHLGEKFFIVDPDTITQDFYDSRWSELESVMHDLRKGS